MIDYENDINIEAIKEIDAKYAEKKDYSFIDEKNDGAALYGED